MENNLLQLVKSYFTDEVVNKFSAQLGEDHDQVRKGLDVSIPSLLLGLQGQSSDGLSSILTSAKHLFGSFNFSDLTSGSFGNSDSDQSHSFESNNIVNSIFGDKIEGIVHSVTNFLGIKSSSVTSLLGAAVPAVISAITNKGSNWDLGNITNLLNNNKSSFASALPTGLGLGAFGNIFANADRPVGLGQSNLVEEVASVVTPVEPVRATEPKVTHTQHVHVPEEKKRGSGIWWLLVPLVLVGGWLLFGKSCKNDKSGPAVDSVTNTVVEENILPDTNTTIIREYTDVKLPNGTALKAYPGGIEEQLITFVQSDYKSLSDDELKQKWFDFDNLNFETGTAKVTAESKVQLSNIAAILTLFPDLKIKIGGYTDKTGDEAVNKRISKDRSEAVKAYLVEKGLGAQVVDVEGYGSEFATVAADASDAERAKDRRVAVSVRK